MNTFETGESYREVGEKTGLEGSRLDRYVAYMKTRWPETETQKCSDGYAGEWAERFKMRIEYNASDSEGKMVLQMLEI